ncbi:MAG: anti-sigma factor family protein [Acidimicrobiia bacterium]
MHDHDHELIAALAEGASHDARSVSAEAALAGCPECLTELEAQRTALRALREAPPPRLTELERARLHRAVAGELGIRRPRRLPERISWGAIAVAAAALVGVALAGPILFGLDGGADEASPEAAPTATTAAAATAAPEAAAELRATALPQWIDLGEVDEEDLRLLFDHPARQSASSYTRQEASDLSSEPPAGPTDLTCYQESLALSDRNELLVLVGTATFQGRESEIYLFASASEDDPGAPLDRAVLWVLEAGSCRILNTQEG